jgi:hypothetical protein
LLHIGAAGRVDLGALGRGDAGEGDCEGDAGMAELGAELGETAWGVPPAVGVPPLAAHPASRTAEPAASAAT